MKQNSYSLGRIIGDGKAGAAGSDYKTNGLGTVGPEDNLSLDLDDTVWDNASLDHCPVATAIGLEGASQRGVCRVSRGVLGCRCIDDENCCL